MSDVLRKLPKDLITEAGWPPIGVNIKRPNTKHCDEDYHHCSVGEFLSRLENQSGEWLIDGGWGGPPGPIKVRWDAELGVWVNLGFPPWPQPFNPYIIDVKSW